MTKIIIDHREPKSLIRELAKKHDIEVKQLITADFIIQGKDTEGNDLNIGIERKSVVESTPVIIKQNEGIKILPIKEAYSLFKQSKRIEVPGIDIKNKNIGWFKVYNVSKHRSSDIYRISTSPDIKKKYKKEEKSIVKITGGHNVYVIKRGKIDCIPTSKLKKGNYLILAPPKLNQIKPKPYESIEEFLKDVQSDSIKNFRLFKTEFKLGSALHRQKIPKFDKNFFFVLGLWAAEGRYGNKTLEFSHKEAARNKVIETYLKKVFKWFNKTQEYYHAGGKVYYKLFKDILKLKEGSKNKEIPSIVFEAPNSYKAEFIKGYFFGDGYRNLNKNRRNPQLATSSKSRLLIVGLSYLFYSLGIENNVHQDYKTYKNERRKYYLLRIKTISLKNFITKIGQIPTKEIKIRDTMSTKIPFYLKTILKRSVGDLSKKDLNYIYRESERIKNKKLGNKKLLKLKKILHIREISAKKIYEQIEIKLGEDLLFCMYKIHQGELFLARVYNIEKIKGSQEVYDFSVRKAENFVGGLVPLLLHNTKNDFLNSIIDKRIFNQLIYLKDNFTVSLLIIEGRENIYQIRNFHPNAIRGMLATITIDFQIPIINTNNYRDTTAFINIIANRLENPKKIFPLLKKRKPLTLKEQQELVLESLPKIGPNLAKSLLKKFKSVKKVINASEERLKKVKKIGKKKASQIREVIDSPYN